ncbi:hypothetical protein Bca4012_018766 [Brassica carinata]
MGKFCLSNRQMGEVETRGGGYKPERQRQRRSAVRRSLQVTSRSPTSNGRFLQARDPTTPSPILQRRQEQLNFCLAPSNPAAI